MPAWISNIADVIGILSAVLAAIFSIKTNLELRRERKRLNGKINIVLKRKDGEKRYQLPVGMTREELSRAEILGRLGMIPIDDKKKITLQQPRYAIDQVNTEEFLTMIDKIRNGDGDSTLEIECSEKEFAQFDFTSKHQKD